MSIDQFENLLSLHDDSRMREAKPDHFKVAMCLCLKRFLEQDRSFENEFDLHENKSVGKKHFHTDGSAGILVFDRDKKQPGTGVFKRGLNEMTYTILYTLMVKYRKNIR